MKDVVFTFLKEVMQWVKEEIKAYIKKEVIKCFLDSLPEWVSLLRDTLKKGYDWGLTKLKELKKVIMYKIRKNEEELLRASRVVVLGPMSGFLIGIALGSALGGPLGVGVGVAGGVLQWMSRGQ